MQQLRLLNASEVAIISEKQKRNDNIHIVLYTYIHTHIFADYREKKCYRFSKNPVFMRVFRVFTHTAKGI